MLIVKKFKGISNLTISANVHGILTPEESLTGKTSFYVLENTLLHSKRRIISIFPSCIVVKLYQLSTAESQRVINFKVSPRRKHKGTREIHEIIQYTPHKLYRPYDRM